MQKNKFWDIREVGKTDEESVCYIELVQSDSEDLAGRYYARVKFDGCVHFGSENEPDPDYIYICNLDHVIALLTEARSLAKQYFGDSWGDSRRQLEEDRKRPPAQVVGVKWIV